MSCFSVVFFRTSLVSLVYTSKIISENRIIAGVLRSITVSGAGGQFSDEINGIFNPTAEVFGGQVVYQKEDDANTFLEYRPTDNQWAIVTAEGKGGKSDYEQLYAFLKTSNCQLFGTYAWSVSDDVGMVQ